MIYQHPLAYLLGLEGIAQLDIAKAGGTMKRGLLSGFLFTLWRQQRRMSIMRVLCGLVGAGVGLLAIKAIPPPNLKLTSYATGYDLLTGHPHLAWRGWVIVAAVLVGFAIGSILYRRSADTQAGPPPPLDGAPSGDHS